MNRFMLLATLGDRMEMVETFLDSYLRYTPDWNLVIVAQEYTRKDLSVIRSRVPSATIIDLPKRVGMHWAKVTGLREIEKMSGGRGYVVCSVDDDMEFIEQTDYSHIVAGLLENREWGLASANWAPNETWLAKKRIEKTVIKQPIVYTGGGLLFRHDIARLICTLPNEPYFSDNTVWSVHVYVNGYENVRVKSSLALHRVCRVGGRKSFVQTRECSLYDESLIKFEAAKKVTPKQQWKIATSKGLTEKARAVHQIMKDYRSKR